MPNWKKVIVSGSDANLTDVTIDDWGSISASLASIEAGGASQTLQDVTDNGATTNNVISAPGITINTTGSQDFLKFGFQAGESATNSATAGDGGVIIGTQALRDFNGSTEKVTIVGNYNAAASTNFGDLVTLVGSTIAQTGNIGDYTTAVGAQALSSGLTGGNSGTTAIGASALFNFKGGNYNTALGYNAGPQAILTGSEGIYIGYLSGIRHNATNAQVPPSQSIYIGTSAKSTFATSTSLQTKNEIVIGNNVNGNGTNTVTIGNSSTTNNYFSGDIDVDDVTIDGWGSISASLSSIETGGTSQTFQQVTDNGNTTTNKIIVQGVDIGRGNNTAANSVAIGDDALKSNTTNGVGNTAIGDAALEFTTTGQSNTAVGHQAAEGNTTGFFNVAVGAASLFSNQKGRYNIAIGTNAGSYVHTSNLGNSAPTSSIFIGAETKASTSNNENQIVIGFEASGSGNNTVTIGNSSITDNYFSGNININNAEFNSGKITVADGVTAGFGSFSAETYAGAVVDYVVYNSGRTNQRTGMVTVTSNTTEVLHSELVTTDIGDTDGVFITTTISGGNFRVNIENNSGASVDAIYNIRLLKI